MRTTTALLLTAVLATACTAGSPVGFIDSARVVTESVESHMLLDEPDAKLRQTQEAAVRAQDAAAHADEVTAAAKKETFDKAVVAFDEAKKARATAGKTLDDRIAIIAGKLAAARRMSLVISFDGKPVYAASGTDLTNEVVEALDGNDDVARAARTAKDAVQKYRALVDAASATGPPKKEKKK